MTTDIFSNENQTTDYTSISGIRTRTGINADYSFGTFIVKELMDNALDYIDLNAKKFEDLAQNPYVKVIITKEEEILIIMK